jgi:DivIVA domain-containing protein
MSFMAEENSEFSTELRGYKRSEVDEALLSIRKELIAASKDTQSALEELKSVKEQLASIDASGAEAHSPTYSGLGGRLEAVLRIAEEQSTKLIGQADIDAERIIAQAKSEATSILEGAQREAERVTLDATNEATTTLNSAEAESKDMVREAKEEAERVRKEAIEEASAIRGSVATEAAKLRATAKRETDAQRAEVKREMSELRVVAERELSRAREEAAVLRKEIKAERASHEITLRKVQEEAALARTIMEQDIAETSANLAFDNENLATSLTRKADQARADLEAELAGRRAEAERELLDTHQKAVELNNHFLEEAKKQLGETKARLDQLRSEQKKILQAIEESSRQGKSEAERDALKALQLAKAKASEIISAAESEATSRVADAERRLVELRAERDTIAEYIEGLREAVTDLLKAPTPQSMEKKTTAKVSTPRRGAPKQDSAAS